MTRRSAVFLRVVRCVTLVLCLSLFAATAAASTPAVPPAGSPSPVDGALALLAVQQAQLTAADGLTSDLFGWPVAIAGDTAVVGAPGGAGESGPGKVYVFQRSGATWTEQTQLTPAGPHGAEYGHAVAISGDTVVVGSVGDNDWVGAAYVFVRSGATWSEQGKLTADDGVAGDYFGSSVAISGDTVAVGVEFDSMGDNEHQGSAYVFVRSGTAWNLQQKLTAGDGAGDDYFGYGVGIKGRTLVAGAPMDDDGANVNEGSAYIFTRSGTVWSEQRKLKGAGLDPGVNFGWSAAISGNTVVVGVPFAAVGDVVLQGAAYVFVGSGASWSLQKRLTAVDGATQDGFGYAVAISGDDVVVGAYGDDVAANTDQGSAYVFVRRDGVWRQKAKVAAADGASDDTFGWSTAVANGMAVVGARFDDVGVNADQGSAYVFLLAKPGRPAARSPKGLISSRTPVLRWAAAARATTYEVRIYRGSTLLQTKNGIATTSWQATKRLPRDVWLTWKVRARNALGAGSWSASPRFKVR